MDLHIERKNKIFSMIKPAVFGLFKFEICQKKSRKNLERRAHIFQHIKKNSGFPTYTKKIVTLRSSFEFKLHMKNMQIDAIAKK